ncbi:MAG TPA: anthranilate phosphoribosyltransferase [Actinobacteria bacterium]|nr:anthranilate phosphoribosyltransferase [Actinomycetota bacterium]
MAEFDWSTTLQTLIERGSIDRARARAAMTEIMEGRATDAQIAAFVVALRAKGETAEEMTGMVEAMMDAAVTVEISRPVVDLVGTGGDRAGTFNISTTAAFVAAGAGAVVAKHGNRAVSSRAGSADVLEALGVVVDLEPEAAVELVERTGFGFFFAPRYHPAMRHAARVRRELGIRSVFNFLGPLCNPAGAERMAVGTSDPAMAELMIRVLAERGVDYGFVFYGEDGLDELTTTGPSFIYRLRDGEITHAEFTPEDFGVARSSLEALVGGDAEENAAITRAVLAGERGPRRDVVLVNATPAIVAAGLAEGFVPAMDLAAESIDSGAAAEVLARVVEESRRLADGPERLR